MIPEALLRQSLTQINLGTGALPVIEPWRRLAKETRRLGRDTTPFTEPLWNIVYGGKAMTEEADALGTAVILRVLTIAGLMIGLRCMIVKMSQTPFSLMKLPAGVDGTVIAFSFILTGMIVSAALKALPQSWLLDRGKAGFSGCFFAWLELLLLDGPGGANLMIAELNNAQTERLLMRRAELQDGCCRERQRQLIVLEAAAALNRKDRTRLARYSANLPFLDLMTAALLCLGTCGVPFVEWLLQSSFS